MEMAEWVLTAMAGLALAATAGFRVFVPLLVAGLAVRSGHLEVAEDMVWIGTTPALVTLGLATLLEAAAVQIPWLDNLLDVLAGPAAFVAGAVLTAGFVIDVSPWLRWTLGAVSGGAAAGLVHGGMAMARASTTLMTGGLANPVVAILETLAAVVAAVLAVLAPVVALVALLLAVWAGVRVAQRVRDATPMAQPST